MIAPAEKKKRQRGGAGESRAVYSGGSERMKEKKDERKRGVLVVDSKCFILIYLCRNEVHDAALGILLVLPRGKGRQSQKAQNIRRLFQYRRRWSQLVGYFGPFGSRHLGNVHVTCPVCPVQFDQFSTSTLPQL
jgi:hypothetical protein